MSEFTHGMDMINEQLGRPLSSLQIKNLHHAMDKDGDGYVNYEEFFDALKVVDMAEERLEAIASKSVIKRFK
jgi:Ca2+-binding EF-hand superfamily protein